MKSIHPTICSYVHWQSQSMQPCIQLNPTHHSAQKCAHVATLSRLSSWPFFGTPVCSASRNSPATYVEDEPCLFLCDVKVRKSESTSLQNKIHTRKLHSHVIYNDVPNTCFVYELKWILRYGNNTYTEFVVNKRTTAYTQSNALG